MEGHIDLEEHIFGEASDEHQTTIGSYRFVTYGDCSSFHEPDAPLVFNPFTASVLQGLRAKLISDFMGLELLMNLPIAAHSQQDTHPFHQNVFEKFIELTDGTFGQKLDRFRDWMRKNKYQFQTLSETEFYEKAAYIVDIRNGLLHYPLNALQLKNTNKMIPFIYSTKNKTTYILDIKRLIHLSVCSQKLTKELEIHREKWFPIRQGKPIKNK